MKDIKTPFLIFFLLLSLGANAEVKWKVLREFDLKTKKAGPNLKKIVGKKVTISGFMIPLDYSKKALKEFLLVPYMPSCSHVPPPPANQIIKVKLIGKASTKVNYAPIEVEGVLKLAKQSPKKDPYGLNGVFSIEGTSVKKVDHSKKK